MPEIAPQLPTLTPDEIHERFTLLISEGMFPNNPTPALVYSWAGYIATVQQSPYVTTYGTTALTTGGAGSPDKNGHSLDIGEAIRRNTAYATDLMATAVQDNPEILSADTAMNPGRLGKAFYYKTEYWGSVKLKGESWSQQDYLRVWFSYLAGIRQKEPEQAALSPEDRWWLTNIRLESLFDAHHTLTEHLYPQMNDKTLDETTRLLAYRTFAESFADCASIMEQSGHISLNPVQFILKLIGAQPDSPRSLGVAAEMHLGKYMGITPLELVLAGDQWDLARLSELHKDLESRNTPFAVPAGKLALALSAYEPTAPIPPVDPESVRHLLDDPIANEVAATHKKSKEQSQTMATQEVHAGIATLITDIHYNKVMRSPYNQATVQRLLHEEYPPAKATWPIWEAAGTR